MFWKVTQLIPWNQCKEGGQCPIAHFFSPCHRKNSIPEKFFYVTQKKRLHIFPSLPLLVYQLSKLITTDHSLPNLPKKLRIVHSSNHITGLLLGVLWERWKQPSVSVIWDNGNVLSFSPTQSVMVLLKMQISESPVYDEKWEAVHTFLPTEIQAHGFVVWVWVWPKSLKEIEKRMQWTELSTTFHIALISNAATLIFVVDANTFPCFNLPVMDLKSWVVISPPNVSSSPCAARAAMLSQKFFKFKVQSSILSQPWERLVRDHACTSNKGESNQPDLADILIVKPCASYTSECHMFSLSSPGWS